MTTGGRTSEYLRSGTADPRLLDQVGREYAAQNGILPLRRAGALTVVAARDMWARIETIDHLEKTLGPIAFVASESDTSYSTASSFSDAFSAS